MTEHHQLTGKFAIHQAAFFQNTDPALDADNFVLKGKWWVDSSAGNALKVRNDANNGWITVIAGAGQAGVAWFAFDYVVDLDELAHVDLPDLAWVPFDYL